MKSFLQLPIQASDTPNDIVLRISVPTDKRLQQSILLFTHTLLFTMFFANGKILHVAGAVGLLTRNVRVINRSPTTDLFGFRIYISDYATNIYNPVGQEYLYTYYKGYARLSNTQFIGYGQFVDAANEDKREGIHMYNLGDWNASRPTYIDSCAFDTGSYSAIGAWDTNGVPITNNVVYIAYESAIVVTGQNNIIDHNLVSTVYWSGTAQPAFAQYDINNDGAIMSRDAISVVMRNNMVAGVERQAYRIQGNACPGTVVPTGINNDYENNEAHSAMAGVVIWPNDKGFNYDTSCMLITGFQTYKAWYYGLYLNTPHNIIVDSCTVVDGNVGMFTFVLGPAAVSHVAGNNSIIIRNSLIVGAISPNDCTDILDTTTVNYIYSQKAIPTVSATSSSGNPGGRSGIVFPFFSLNNLVPSHPWTGIEAYPAISGVMQVTNVTLTYFNTVCNGRQDIAIQIAQHNDDGQHPVMTSLIFVYNTTQSNLIFNGRPNLDVVDPSDCVDMDCDGLKKDLLTDTDGTLFGQPSTVFSQAEYLWGDQQHGVGDFRIPSVALANSNGQMINISSIYPLRGIGRDSVCTYRSAWQMYLCPNETNYRMMIIESMDSDTETRRLSPVAIMSDTGTIDLINGPQDHGWCNGYTCQKRISTFMSIIESKHHFDIYLSSTTPNQIRFRILNADTSIIITLGLYYSSLQQIDVYANGIYVPPTNRDLSFNFLMLTDTPTNVTLASPAGTNYFNRTSQMATFVIDGVTVIDLKISELIVLTFGLPPQTPDSFFSSGIVANLAALLGISANQIRRVDIIAANTTRIRRQLSTTPIYLRVEIRDDPIQSLSSDSTNQTTNQWNLVSTIMNQYQSGDLQANWPNMTNGTTLISLNVRQPFNQTSIALSVISRIVLVMPPSDCREQSACTIQPVVVAYDANNNVIEQLGSTDQPWQVVATIISPLGATPVNAIANYVNGQAQYTAFGLPGTGSYQIQFAFIQPDGVRSSFVASVSLIASSGSVSVTKAVLSAKQVNNASVVSVNQTFNVSVVVVDAITRIQIGDLNWRGLNWSAAASLYTLSTCNSNGVLINSNGSSEFIISATTGTITVTNLAINATGMYVIKVRLTSNNNEFLIDLTSNGILVKKNTTILTTQTGSPTSNVTFTGDYDAWNVSNQLEIKRAIIYNCLISRGMAIAGDILLVKGSVIAILDPGTDASSIGTAVTSLINNPTIDSDLTVKSVNMNGQSYTVGSSSSSSSTSGSSSTVNVGLIIGLVIGIGGAIALLGLGSTFGYREYNRRLNLRRLTNEPDPEIPLNSYSVQDEVSPRISPSNSPNLTRRLSALPTNIPPANNTPEPLRTGSAALSSTGLQVTMNSPMPDVERAELIKFD